METYLWLNLTHWPFKRVVLVCDIAGVEGQFLTWKGLDDKVQGDHHDIFYY